MYEVGRSPRRVDGEPRLGFPPLQVCLTEEGEWLHKESRINYSKLVTVEHNVRVFFIGSIVQDNWQIIEDAVNQCWDSNKHNPKIFQGHNQNFPQREALGDSSSSAADPSREALHCVATEL